MPAPPLTGTNADFVVSPSYCFQDAGTSTPCTVGSTCQRWYDVTLGGFLEQPTAASRPTLRQDAASNYYLEFDGIDDYMDSGTALMNGAVFGYSLALTVRELPTSGQIICRASHTGSTTAHGIFFEASHIAHHCRNSGGSFLGFRYRDLHPNASVVVQNLWDTTNDILYHRCNGTSTGSGSIGSATLTPGNLNHFRVGANSGTAGVYGKINVYGLVYGNGLWTEGERAALESYHAGLLPDNYVSPALNSLSSPTTLWTSGTGYNTFRIPAICWYDDGTTNGVLIACCEGRSTVADDSDIDIVIRRSTDLGSTWTASAVAQANGTNVAGNPTLVADPANGKVHLLFVRQTAGDGAGHGATTRRPWYTYSTDSGATWASPVELTSVREAGWSWYAIGPGRGAVLPNGRIVVPANHSDATYGSPFYKAHLIYSDDGGTTWSKSSDYGPLGASEGCLDVSGTSVIVANRNEGSGNRLFMVSSDGATVSDGTQQTDLDGTPCQGSMTILGGRMLYAHVAASTRSDCCVLSTTDIDATPVFDRGSEISFAETANPAGAAYSAMCRLPTNDVAILWEYGTAAGNYNEIRFNTFTPLGVEFGTPLPIIMQLLGA